MINLSWTLEKTSFFLESKFQTDFYYLLNYNLLLLSTNLPKTALLSDNSKV